VPISLLIRSFALKSGFSFAAGSNEYLYLQDALNNTFAEKEKIDKRLKQHHNAIRSHFLQGLLKGRPDQNVPVHEALAAHDIRVVSPYYAVLLFHIENYGKFEAEGYVEPRNVKLLQFIVMNVAEEVTTERHQAFTTELDDMPTCIVNFVADPDENELRRIAGHVKSFLLDHFHVHLTVAISAIHQDLYGIARAYQETIEAMQYRLVMGSGEMIGYSDLPAADAGAEQSSYYYPLHLEQQLMNLVKTGDYERSNELIQTIVQMNTQGASLSVPLAKCLMFDLIGTMLKTLDELGPDNKRKVLEHVDPIERLTGCETIKDMQVQIRDVLERVCGSIREDRRSESNTIGQQVIAYVTEHYSDENLNISTIGEAFGLTPSYLSKQFKTQTGEALLEFINKTRLEHAKRLLAEPSQALSVSEIARKVGYADINTFNRIFKKYEGITPSKFKEMS
jgi:AraC-like DNA-binding protein